MEFLVCIVLVVLVYFLFKYKRESEESKRTVQTQINQIEQKNSQILKVKQERDAVKSQVENYIYKINNLKGSLDEANRKLEFYTNIKEDSKNLNEQVELSNDTLLDDEQALVFEKMEESYSNFFVTGKAGTGKSFLLDFFRNKTKKSNIVLAPTGIAALNVDGATLHSTFGYYNLVNLNVDMISEKTIRLKSEKKLILKKVSTIIIDEISMVRADTFDKIDRILKVINQTNLPFGGKQILLFGDLFQLPPVTKSKEYEYLFDRYGGIYFFNSDAYKKGNFNFLELTINHRQKDDANYFELLNRVRDGSLTDDDLATLNSRVAYDLSLYNRFTTLLPTKAEVEMLNQHHIDQLDTVGYSYKAEIVFDKYPNKNHNLETIFPISNMLYLKKGVLVMMVANDSDHRWVNGTLGIVENLSDKWVSVAIDGRVFNIHPLDFTEQEVSYVNGKITYEEVLKVKQFPLIPAYAITIHKSQGQTYQNIVCDIDKCFADGQAYVALSRCASLSGLHLKSPISGASIHVDKCVLDFYHDQITM